MRQALALAVNKPAIIEAVFHGAGQPAKNLLPPTQWGSNAQLEDYPYSPERAKQLLQEAGLGQGLTSICGRCRCSGPTTPTPSAWRR